MYSFLMPSSFCSFTIFISFFLLYIFSNGDIAQLARASALQAEGQGFKSPYLQSDNELEIIHFKFFEKTREGKRKRE